MRGNKCKSKNPKTKEEFKRKLKEDLSKDMMWYSIMYLLLSIKSNESIKNEEDFLNKATDILWEIEK